MPTEPYAPSTDAPLSPTYLPPTTFSHEAKQFLRDGQPHQIISGALHYFRVPAPLWADRLQRLAAMGCNTVETYVAWNFHQPWADTDPDFSGDHDLGAFLDAAAAAGLDALVRPGPFICAEWDFGGLPSWLLADPYAAPALRTSDPAYLDHVDRWFDQLLPIIVRRQHTRGGPVIGVQVENEYGSYGNDHDYLVHLRDGLIERGVDTMLFTSDGPGRLMLQGGTLDDVLATVNFGSRHEEAFNELTAYRPDTATMCMEFWNGWFDHWGTPHHTRPAGDAAAELEGMLTAGHSVNFYMAHGGTSFGTWSGANCMDGPDGPEYQPTVSSYDYDSPISEDGTLSEKFWAFRTVIEKHTGRTLPKAPPTAPKQPAQSVPITGFIDLDQHLDQLESRPSPTPESFEELGIHHGVVRYRTTLPGPHSDSPLRLDGLADLAAVSVDRQLVGRLGRAQIDPAFGAELSLNLPQDSQTLDVLVHSLGRVNFGPHLRDPKGVQAVRLDYQHLFGWEQVGFDVTNLPELSWSEDQPPVADRPGFHRASLTLDNPADAFVSLPGWHLGYVFLNGFNLGRYWNPAGPHQTLYAPAPLWSAGENELVILEFVTAGDRIEIVDSPNLG